MHARWKVEDKKRRLRLKQAEEDPHLTGTNQADVVHFGQCKVEDRNAGVICRKQGELRLILAGGKSFELSRRDGSDQILDKTWCIGGITDSGNAKYILSCFDDKYP